MECCLPHRHPTSLLRRPPLPVRPMRRSTWSAAGRSFPTSPSWSRCTTRPPSAVAVGQHESGMACRLAPWRCLQWCPPRRTPVPPRSWMTSDIPSPSPPRVVDDALNFTAADSALCLVAPVAPDPFFERTHDVVDACSHDADRQHASHHHGWLDIALALDDQVTEAGGAHDELGADQRLPAEARADAQAGDHVRKRTGQHDILDHV